MSGGKEFLSGWDYEFVWSQGSVSPPVLTDSALLVLKIPLVEIFWTMTTLFP